MAFIRTVVGDIAEESLGVTDAHDHLFLKDGLILVREPDFRLDSVEKAMTEVSDFASFGGRAIVDMGPLGVGRDTEGMIAVARATSVHVIAVTGLHKPVYYLDSHWRHRLSVEETAALFIEEIEDGMDIYSFEGPERKRSSARAGAIKVATDYQKITPAVSASFQAAAQAHLETGAPILTHTEMGTMGMQQIELLQKEGVSPRHVMLSHVDRNTDWRLHRDMAQTGAFLEYDGPGRIKYQPEGDILDLLAKMFELGLGDQITLGGDTARRSVWKSYGGGIGISYILEQFVPRLRREGFTEQQVHALLVANPARALSFREAS